MAKAKKAKPGIVDKIGKWHSRVFEYVSKKQRQVGYGQLYLQH